MASTSIEWADAVWNPIAGCTWASAGCDHCYAATMTRRLEGMGQKDYAGLTTSKHFNGTIRTLPNKLDIPLRRKKPTRYFVNSMSDLFHKDVPDEFIDQVFAVMALCPQHTFQVLTKRPERMARYWTDGIRNGRGEHTSMYVMRALHRLADRHGVDPMRLDELGFTVDDRFPPNCWLGTSIENQEQADKRIPYLLQTPTTVRWLSIEPLLGVVDLTTSDIALDWSQAIDWVVVGGESGHGARPMHPQWVRSLRDSCVAAGVPFFFKQWGAYLPVPVFDAPEFAGGKAFDNPNGGRSSATIRFCSEKAFTSGESRAMKAGDERRDGVMLDDDTFAIRVGKKDAGRLLDGREWNEFPGG